ncbi:MAG: hypothetical protein K6G25_13105 [Bacteroidales bacterium]|nr:hypothetical protein [Bacteroidales bacterium]
MLCIREPQDAGKFFNQIADLPNSYVLADDIESPRVSCPLDGGNDVLKM